MLGSLMRFLLLVAAPKSLPILLLLIRFGALSHHKAPTNLRCASDPQNKNSNKTSPAPKTTTRFLHPTDLACTVLSTTDTSNDGLHQPAHHWHQDPRTHQQGTRNSSRFARACEGGIYTWEGRSGDRRVRWSGFGDVWVCVTVELVFE